ncbi:MAG: M28 family peptidase [Bacteroidales bacterium]|nr:M28 family peptidase [Bacteroidales bacterium]
MKNIFKIIVTLIILLYLTSCNCNKENPQTNNGDTTQTKKIIITADFNADSAYLFIKKQVDFGPRVCNSKAHDKCEKYITDKLKEFSSDVIIQKANVTAFDGKILNCRNIIASFNPGSYNRIALFTHWDSRPFADQDTINKDKPIDGANDGASGVAILIEIARQLKIKQPNIGVDIILLDAEDYGQPEYSMLPKKENSYCLGSQYWAKNLHKEKYSANFGILLDMVGAKDATFRMEGLSMYFAKSTVNKVWDIANNIGYSGYFLYEGTGEITDDHYYINTIAKIPCIDIIQIDAEGRFGDYWHTHDDNMKIIDKNTLKAVGQTLIEVIYREGEEI